MENNLKNLINSKRKHKNNGYITLSKKEICQQTLKFELGEDLDLDQTFTMIRFQENTWSGVIIESADFSSTSLSFCTLQNCSFTDIAFSQSQIISSTVKDSCFHNCNWDESQFVNSTFTNCIFSGGSLPEAEFKSCTFICTKFELDVNTAILMNCKFSNNYDKSIQFDKEVDFIDVKHQINSITDNNP